MTEVHLFSAARYILFLFWTFFKIHQAVTHTEPEAAHDLSPLIVVRLRVLLSWLKRPFQWVPEKFSCGRGNVSPGWWSACLKIEQRRNERTTAWWMERVKGGWKWKESLVIARPWWALIHLIHTHTHTHTHCRCGSLPAWWDKVMKDTHWNKDGRLWTHTQNIHTAVFVRTSADSHPSPQHSNTHLMSQEEFQIMSFVSACHESQINIMKTTQWCSLQLVFETREQDVHKEFFNEIPVWRCVVTTDWRHKIHH